MAVALDPHAGPWTEADLLSLPEGGPRIELLEGTLLVNPPSSTPHQLVSLNLALALREAVGPGLVVVEAVGVRGPADTVLIPDVLVVSREAALANRSGIHDAEDVLLVVEIVSPSSRTADRLAKPSVYARAGIPSYWRVEPEEGPSIVAYRLDGEAYVETGSARPGDPLTLEVPFPLWLDPSCLRP